MKRKVSGYLLLSIFCLQLSTAVGQTEGPEDVLITTESMVEKYQSFDELPGGSHANASQVQAVLLEDPLPVQKSLFSGKTIMNNAGILEDLQHECVRECNLDTVPKQCYYHFLVEWYSTMSKACFNCPFNMSDCERKHCVHTDGHERAIVTVNRRLPGPLIHVCAGDEIMVDVENDLISDSTSMHWHGLFMRGTQYMDGVPFLTQCPILAGSVFRYHFLADKPGTHYWHSHSALQRTDGLFGPLVIQSRNDSQKDLYDVDDPRHMLTLTDWMDGLGFDKFVNHHHTEHDNKPYNILVNGFGKYKQIERNATKSHLPVYEVVVKQGLRYRFRTLGNSIQNCPIQISVDDHMLLAIASDGNDIDPIEVHSLTVFGGERWDFVVKADQPIGVYWMKFRGLLDCDDRFKSAHQVVLVRYEGASGLPTEMDDVDFSSTYRDGLELNKLNAAPGDFSSFLTSADAYSLADQYDITKYNKKPDYKFWFDFDFYSIDNPFFHNKELYPFSGVRKSRRLFMPQVNHISMKLPNVPPLSQLDQLDGSMLCNSTSRSDCETSFCSCTHVLKLTLGSLVEIILVDTGVVYWANHPFHLHGQAFAVMGMGRFGEEVKLETVKQFDADGKMTRNFINPPLKDTVTVPDGGYTVIRFVADNPGFWFFHCHIAFHSEVGMGVVFQVGEPSDLPPVPKDFPTCGSWAPKPVVNLASRVNQWEEKLVNIDSITIVEQEESLPRESTASSLSPGFQWLLVFLLLLARP